MKCMMINKFYRNFMIYLSILIMAIYKIISILWIIKIHLFVIFTNTYILCFKEKMFNFLSV